MFTKEELLAERERRRRAREAGMGTAPSQPQTQGLTQDQIRAELQRRGRIVPPPAAPAIKGPPKPRVADPMPWGNEGQAFDDLYRYDRQTAALKQMNAPNPITTEWNARARQAQRAYLKEQSGPAPEEMAKQRRAQSDALSQAVGEMGVGGAAFGIAPTQTFDPQGQTVSQGDVNRMLPVRFAGKAIDAIGPGTANAVLELGDAMFGPGPAYDMLGNPLQFDETRRRRSMLEIAMGRQEPVGSSKSSRMQDMGRSTFGTEQDPKIEMLPTVPLSPPKDEVEMITDFGGTIAGALLGPGKAIPKEANLGRVATNIGAKGTTGAKALGYGTRISGNIAENVGLASIIGANMAPEGQRVEMAGQLAADPLTWALGPALSAIYRSSIGIRTLGASITPQSIQLKQARQILLAENATDAQKQAAIETIDRMTPPVSPQELFNSLPDGEKQSVVQRLQQAGMTNDEIVAAIRSGNTEPPVQPTAQQADDVGPAPEPAPAPEPPPQAAAPAGPAPFSRPGDVRAPRGNLVLRNADRVVGGTVGGMIASPSAAASAGDDGSNNPLGTAGGVVAGALLPRLAAQAGGRTLRAAQRAAGGAKNANRFDERIASSTLRKQFERAGLTSPAAVQEAMRAAFGNQPATLADLTQEGLSTAVGLTRLPGSTAENAARRAAELADTSMGRTQAGIEDAIRGVNPGLNPGTIAGDVDELIAAAQAEASPLYRALRAQYPLGSLDSGRLMELLDQDIMRPHVQAAQRYRDTIAISEGRQVGDFEFVDIVKRSLDDAEQKAISRNERVPYDLESARVALLEEMDRLVPRYAEARRLGGEAPRMRQAFSEGQRLLQGRFSVEDIGRIIQETTGAALTATQAGVIRAMIGKVETGRGALQALTGPGTRQKLARVFGQEAADAMQARFKAEEALMRNARQMDPNVGSVTSRAMLSEPAGIGPMIAEAVNTVRNPLEAGLAYLSKSGAYSQAQRDLMGEMLLGGATDANLARIFPPSRTRPPRGRRGGPPPAAPQGGPPPAGGRGPAAGPASAGPVDDLPRGPAPAAAQADPPFPDTGAATAGQADPSPSRVPISEQVGPWNGPVPKKPQSLIAWIKSQGGIKDTNFMTGDLRSIMGRSNGMPGLLNNKSGTALDELARKAHTEGFDVDPEDANSLMRLIDEEFGGNPSYRIGAREEWDIYQEWLAARRGDFDDPTSRSPAFIGGAGVGALTGAAMNPDDPAAGALIGAGVGGVGGAVAGRMLGRAGPPPRRMPPGRGVDAMGLGGGSRQIGGRGSAAERFSSAAIKRESKVADLSRSKLIEMPIDDFLRLARKGNNDQKLSGVKGLLDKNEPFESLPYLMINRDGSVRGHEGRHRARALKDAGYDTMPVIVRSENIRWSEQGNPNADDYVDEWPRQLTAEAGAESPGFAVPFPISREQATQPYRVGSAPTRASSDDIIRQAQSQGYTGQDIGEAQEWVRAREKGLDMSQGARMQRVNTPLQISKADADEMVRIYNKNLTSVDERIEQFRNSNEGFKYHWQRVTLKDLEEMFGADEIPPEALRALKDDGFAVQYGDENNVTWAKESKAPTEEDFWADAANERGWLKGYAQTLDDVLSPDMATQPSANLAAVESMLYLARKEGWQATPVRGGSGRYWTLSKTRPDGEEVFVSVRVSDHARQSWQYDPKDINLAPQVGANNAEYAADDFTSMLKKLRAAEAAFDPAEAGSRNILGANPAAIGGAAGVVAPYDTDGDGVIDANDRAASVIGNMITGGVGGAVAGRLMPGAARRGPPTGPATMGVGGNKGPLKPSAGNKNKLEPAFRSVARLKVGQSIDRRANPPIVQKFTPNNAAKQLTSIDRVLRNHPVPEASSNAWSRMMAEMVGDVDAPAPPYKFIKDMQDNAQGAVARLKTLTREQIAEADHGFLQAEEFRQAYADGMMQPVDTTKLFMWSFLSRGVSPYVQESMFLDAFRGADQWIKLAVDGKFDAKAFAKYKRWASKVSPKGRGLPGSGTQHNLNAFGKDFLFKMSAVADDGRTYLQKLHDMFADPDMTGPQIRRAFAQFPEGIGIDNKVLSFTLLASGRKDVMVLDRIQVRSLFNDGRFGDRNIYDPLKVNGKAVSGTALAEITYGPQGLVLYEAIERALSRKVDDIYTAVGRPQDASIGRYHWDTWNAASGQEASHATLSAILNDARKVNNPISGIRAKEGEYGAYAYNAEYGIADDGVRTFQYTTPKGNTYEFTVPAFRDFLNQIKKSKNKVVPSKFKVTDSENAPWTQRPEVNIDALEQLAAKYADRSTGQRAGRRSGASAEGGEAVSRSGPYQMASGYEGLATPPPAPGLGPQKKRQGPRTTLSAFPTADDAAIRQGPTFYSALTRAVEKSSTKSAPASQWKSTLANSPGIKAEEIEWTGVNDWLDLQQGNVTRDELAAYLQNNGVQVEEVVKVADGAGDASVDAIARQLFDESWDTNDWDDWMYETRQNRLMELFSKQPDSVKEEYYSRYMSRSDGEKRAYLDWADDEFGTSYDDTDLFSAEEIESIQDEAWELTHAEYRERAEQLVDDGDIGGEGSTKWSAFKLPGGQNYTELLLKLPETSLSPEAASAAARLNEIDPTINKSSGRRWDDNEVQELRQIVGRAKDEQKVKNYQSSHWEEPNVLAHVRFSERTSADGKRILAIDEIQSDWHQAGREKGYDTAEWRQERERVLKQVNAELLQRSKRDNELYDQVVALARSPEYETYFAEAIKNFNVMGDEYQAAQRMAGRSQFVNGRMPDGLLKQRLLDLMKERDLNEIALRGLEARAHEASRTNIVPNAPFKNNAWASLSLKRMIRHAAENGFDEIAWVPGQVPVERFSLSKQIDSLSVTDAPAAGDDMVILSAYKNGRSVLEETIPRSKLKDYVGAEAAEKVLAKPKERITGARSLDGVDLNVGGEGMRAFYDQILVNEANKIGKKYGVSVKTRQIYTPAGRDGSARIEAGPKTFYSMEITPKVRKMALEGQPLFAFPGAGNLAQAGAGVGGAAYGYARGSDLNEDGVIDDQERMTSAVALGALGLGTAGLARMRMGMGRAKPPSAVKAGPPVQRPVVNASVRQRGAPKPPKGPPGAVSRMVAGGAAGGAVGALAGEAIGQDDLTADIAKTRQEIEDLQAALKEWDKLDVTGKQELLVKLGRVQSYYTNDKGKRVKFADGTTGDRTEAAFNAYVKDKTDALTTARNNLIDFETRSAYREFQQEQNPFMTLVRDLAPPAAMLLAGAGATVLRMRAVGKSKEVAREIESDINNLLTKGEVRKLVKRGGAEKEERNRAANINEFYRLGGAAPDQERFIYGKGGYQPNPKAAKPGTLYAPKTTTKMDKVGSQFLRPNDMKLIGVGVLDSVAINPFVDSAQKELDAAQKDVDGGNKSIEALRRLEKAKTELAMYQTIQRIGWGLAGFGVLGAGYRYKLPRPDIRGAEEEAAAISDYLRANAPPKPPRAPRAPRTQPPAVVGPPKPWWQNVLSGSNKPKPKSKKP